MGLGVVVGFTAVNSLTRPPAEAPMMDDTVPAAQSTVKPNKPGVSPQRADKVVLTDAEWKKRLTPEQYRILRNHGTEAAFCGLFVDNKKTGTYSCVGCKLPLFRSDAKFDSGTGWPSFFQPATADAIWTRTDTSYGMVREEVLCARCDGHLGHVFPDGPRDRGGMRFCINSEILTFQEAK
jgi:methionine-R-sulfoxide reductase